MDMYFGLFINIKSAVAFQLLPTCFVLNYLLLWSMEAFMKPLKRG